MQRRGFTLFELLVVVSSVIVVAGLTVSVIPRLTRSFEESAGRTEVTQALERARTRAIGERLPTGVLFYQWRNPEYDATAGSDEPDPLVARTEYLEIVANPAEPGTFRAVGLWKSLPEGFTVAAPGRQYPQLATNAADLGYPNDLDDMEPGANPDVTGIGFAVLFDELGRLDQRSLQEDVRIVEMLLGGPQDSYVGPPGFERRLFALDRPDGDRMRIPGNQIQRADSTGYNRRLTIDGFAAFIARRITPPPVQELQDVVIRSPTGPAYSPFEDEPITLARTIGHVVDRKAPKVVVPNPGAGFLRVDIDLDAADDLEFGAGEARVFVTGRAFGLTSVFGIIDTEELTQQHAAARRSLGESLNYFQERDFGGSFSIPDDDGSPVIFWNDYKTEADLYPEADFGTSQNTTTNRYAIAMEMWEWIAIHPFTGRAYPTLQESLKP